MFKQKKEASAFLEKAEAEQAENDCIQCAADYRQLAEWLVELKERRVADAQPVDGWINVDERLPKPFERVMCYCISTSGDIDAYMIGCINKQWGLLKGDTFVSEKETHRIVSFWQPLPPKPTIIDYCRYCPNKIRRAKNG